MALSQAFAMLMPHTGNEPIVKSLSVAVTDADDRVSDMKDAKQGGVPSSCVMLMPPSKKLNCGKIPDGPDFGVYAHGGVVGDAFAIAHALSAAPHPPLAAVTVTRSRTFPPFGSAPVPTHSRPRLVSGARRL